ncbi:hypothetical protein [Neobacillus kokaensis]|uniref:Uncharacterized protein n=1 Tax=Neobacillus kokaensis TaxID=2759023 RepID=A0ABQ3NBK2_9BACI|nr:hypothetical protein [Neobacillus kokaensis]GHI01300.1 hypothetical protein AM1BK_48420 [Neobacillus kokaensis]
MGSVQDVLYNWLTIKVVCDARPEDTAAVETKNHFEEMLSEYKISNIDITVDDVLYYVTYYHENESKKTRFPRELIEIMLNQINLEPDKYVNYPEEE